MSLISGQKSLRIGVDVGGCVVNDDPADEAANNFVVLTPMEL